MMEVNENEILWAKVNTNAKIPTKDSEDAGFDIYACFDEDYMVIKSFQTKLIPTGIACALNDNFYLQLEERGSVGSKGIKGSAGVVDSGYRGEIFIAITNCSHKTLIISKIDKNKLTKKLKQFGNSKLDIDALPDCKDKNKEYVISDNFKDCIIHPYDKAICQGIVHIVPKLESKEINYEELIKYKSERGVGNLGSSGK